MWRCDPAMESALQGIEQGFAACCLHRNNPSLGPAGGRGLEVSFLAQSPSSWWSKGRPCLGEGCHEGAKGSGQ